MVTRSGSSEFVADKLRHYVHPIISSGDWAFCAPEETVCSHGRFMADIPAMLMVSGADLVSPM
jgi:hypothetical protein